MSVSMHSLKRVLREEKPYVLKMPPYWFLLIFCGIIEVWNCNFLNIQWFWKFSIEHFQYSIMLKIRYRKFSVFNSIERYCWNFRYYWTFSVSILFQYLIFGIIVILKKIVIISVWYKTFYWTTLTANTTPRKTEL